MIPKHSRFPKTAIITKVPSIEVNMRIPLGTLQESPIDSRSYKSLPAGPPAVPRPPSLRLSLIWEVSVFSSVC